MPDLALLGDNPYLPGAFAQGGFVRCRKRAATTTPMMVEIVWMNSSMAGE